MKKHLCLCGIMILSIFMLSGCTGIGQKNMSISAVYFVTAFLALLILACYLLLCRNKNRWFLLLLTSVTITNTGYWFLSTSQTLDAALAANRLSYLGSVFLPLSMLMIILDTVQAKFKKWLPVLLGVISLFVFAVAASPGRLNIYYAEVTLAQSNGITVLEKVYGPWHRLYLIYLLGYFAVTVGATVWAITYKKIHNAVHAVILALAVFINIGVWLLEQLVKIDFELLSVSYIFSELFLLGLDLLLWEQNKKQSSVIPEPLPANKKALPEENYVPQTAVDNAANFAAQLPTLTPTEKHVYELYIAGKSSKEIMEALAIKENTLKYHNRNIYSKLGVSSRKQMLELAAFECARAQNTAASTPAAHD